MKAFLALVLILTATHADAKQADAKPQAVIETLMKVNRPAQSPEDQALLAKPFHGKFFTENEVDQRAIAMKHINIVFGNGLESDVLNGEDSEQAPADSGQ